jgi:hypothetical protein
MAIQNPGRGEAAASAAASIVIEIPAQLKHLVEPVQQLIKEVDRQVAEHRRDGSSIDYAKVERALGKCVAAIESAANTCALAAVVIDSAQIEVNGSLYTRVGEGMGTYYTMTGPVQLHRGIYRRVGERNGKTVDIISLRIGAIGDGWLPHTAQAMAHEMQGGTSREAEQSARQIGRLLYSRASFERVAHLVGELWQASHANIEDELIRAYAIPAATAAVSVGIDRASVPMEECVPRPPGRPRKNAPKRSVKRVFRMCYVATVTLHDKDGKALHTLRRAQMPDCNPQDICRLLANDVCQLREKRPDLSIMLLADGAHEMWNLLEGAIPASVFGSVHRLIDFWHAIEKLAAAANVICKNDAVLEAKAMLARWQTLLRTRNDAAKTILAELIASGREEVVVDDKNPVHDAITYLRNNLERMHYAGAIKMGLPIGSGNVEATCKTLIGLRMKRCGSRWHNNTGNHILHLRALALSDRWDDALAKLSAKQRTSVRIRAAA